MQNNYNLICKWAHDVGLVINAQKTKFIHIHSSHNVPITSPAIMAHTHECFHSSRISLNCQCPLLEKVNQHTYLGIVIDNRFSWKPHIDLVCSKLRSLLSRLFILKHKLPYKICRTLYLALAQSVISYGLSSYGRTYKTHLNSIYALQLRLLKTIIPKFENKRILNEGDIFNYCNVMDVFTLVKFNILNEVNDPSLLIEKCRPNTLRNIQNSKKFVVPNARNFYGARMLNTIIPAFVNELTEDLQELYLDKRKYRRSLKEHLLKSLSV